MAAVSTIYLFVNVAYFATISKRDILESRQVIACVLRLPRRTFADKLQSLVLS